MHSVWECSSALTLYWCQKNKFDNIYISRSQIIIAKYKWDIMPPRKSARKPQERGGHPRNNQHHCSNHAGIIKAFPTENSPPEGFLYRKHSLQMVFYVENLPPPHGFFFYIKIHPPGDYFINRKLSPWNTCRNLPPEYFLNRISSPRMRKAMWILRY